MKASTIYKGTSIGVIVLITWGLVTGLQADEITLLTPNRPMVTTRILSFPSSQRTGNLYLEPESGPGGDPEHVTMSNQWEHFTTAKGDVHVPEDRNVQLSVQLALSSRELAKLHAQDPLKYQLTVANRVCKDPYDLSGLLELDPNDLFRLSVSSPMYRRTGTTPKIFEPIGRLTGLRMLGLADTGVTDKGLEHLRSLRSLKTLELRESSIGNRELAILKDLPSLEYLDLNTGVTDTGLKQVTQISNLRWLRIRTSKIRGPGLAELKNLPHLERLCIWGTSPISDRHIKHLEGLEQIKSLTLWGRACDALTDASLASISKLKNLEELYFIRTRPRFTPAGVSHLKELKNLKKVDFAQIWIGPAGVYYGDEVVRQLASNLPNLESIKGIRYPSAEGMKMLARFRNLKCLDVGLKDRRQGYYGPTGISHLVGFGSLEELHINSGESLSEADIACLTQLSHLKELHIGSRDLSNRSLASIGKLKQLERLTLFSPVTCSGLNQLSSLTNLQTLNVEVHPAAISPSDRGMLDLSTLTKLNTLTLSSLSLQDADLESLADLHHLERLSLSGTFTQEGLHHLKNLHELKRLSISGISCTAGERLGNLGGLTKLGDLVLRGRITDAALGHLSGLGAIWSLRIETDEPIHSETINHLKQAMPTITYIHIDKPPRTMQPTNRQQRERTRVSRPRLNQRTQQNRRLRR